ncbi:transposase [Streptomyces sp. NBC_00009]|uniref:transposase n=1 Tax=Streptomyces sp. NBC_00009 TaxID=2975620 RepID=UPI00386E92F5
MIRRHELSDEEWEFVRPLLPESLRGRKRLDDRTVLNGIVWKFRTGTTCLLALGLVGDLVDLRFCSSGAWTRPSGWSSLVVVGRC